MTESSHRRLTASDLEHPVNLLALGFGSGLAPRAPGTFGTLVALPLWWLMAGWPPLVYLAVTVGLFVAGVYICGAAARRLGVHDHPGIVFDEIVGYLLTLWALPAEPVWMVAGFIVFRVLDILKPWPIRVLDRRVGGGLGIMADDAVAGVLGCVALHAVLQLV